MQGKIYVIVMMVLYIAGVTYIGYRNRKSEDSEEYFLASRALPSWLLAVTFIASWWGGGSAIDLVDHANREGLSTFWIYGVPVLLSTALMFIFAGGIRRVGTISQPELMAKRYDSKSAFMLTIFIIIFMTLAAAIQVIVVGKFFAAFFGWNYELCAVGGALLVVFYSLWGGFKGVVLTDLLQFFFFLFSAIFLFVMAWRGSGGFEPLMAQLESEGNDTYTDFFHNLGDNIAYVITFGTSWMVQANVWQRISAAKTPQSARKMMAISFFAFIPLYLIVTLTGMLSLATYEVVPKEGVVAAMLMELQSPLVGGIIFVGLCSAIMSTMDSLINTGALSLTLDIYKKYMQPNAAPKQYVLVGRLSTLLIAVVAIYIGVRIDSVLTVSWIGADFIATGAFVPLVLGFLWRRGTAKAALCSMIFGLLFSSYNFAVALGAEFPVAWEIASAEQAIVGIVASLVIYIAVSLLTKPTYEQADRFIEDAQILKHSGR